MLFTLCRHTYSFGGDLVCHWTARMQHRATAPPILLCTVSQVISNASSAGREVELLEISLMLSKARQQALHLAEIDPQTTASCAMVSSS